jgi:arylsulfatase A-like enzyme
MNSATICLFILPVLFSAILQHLAVGGERVTKPNIIFIMADDLGRGELGCYGQKKIRTPNLDQMAKEGILFTEMYAGHCVCAPSRCTLMTGYHTGHSFVRENIGGPVLGQIPLPDATITVAELLKKQGYRTGVIGKWGLGGVRTEGIPTRQGFDFFYGYLDQWNAHNHYPDYMWQNETAFLLEGNLYNEQNTFSHDLFTEQALKFVQTSKKSKPFFLYLAYAVPHVSIQVPQDSLKEYVGQWEETPFAGDHYQGHPTPRAAYAGMVTRMDRDVGKILNLLKENHLEENTLVIFTSDNGPTFNGGTDSKFFESAGPLRGLKTMLYEGGIRVPFIAKWKGFLPAGVVSEEMGAFWDMLPTFVKLAQGEVPHKIDGRVLKSLTDPQVWDSKENFKPEDNKSRILYWEQSNAKLSRQAIREGDWKAYLPDVAKGINALELYNLKQDISETTNLALENPEMAKRLYEMMQNEHKPSEEFPFTTEK